MNLAFNEKVVFVVGSSRGIGFSIAQQFLKEGACVVLSGRDEPSLEAAYQKLNGEFSSDKILKINADLCKKNDIKQAFEKIHSRFKRIDCVIANIGSGREESGLDFDEDTLEKSFLTNLKGSLLLAKQAMEYFKVQKSGNMIFISSIAGVEDINAPVGYSAHKAGLIAASKKLARLGGPYNIRVNVIAPGNIYFEGGGWDKKLKENKNQVEEYINREVSLGCLGEPSDVAHTAVFLSSDKAKFITGSVMVVDGGQTRSF
jgi:3-oxoacyl-[acyl-carrier protein] reductase